MSGRGDNNKHGSAGRGASNQSSQPFNGNDKKANLTQSDTPSMGTEVREFDLLVDDVPYIVKAAPFTYNEQLRFYISVNQGPEHVFTWDEEVKRLRAIDTEASILPDALEEEISERLQSKFK
jgi:hypothetical protein